MADTLPSIGMTFGEAADIILRRLKSDLRLKPRTKAKRRERIRAIQKSWDGINELDVRRIRPAECQKWAKQFQGQVDATRSANFGNRRMIFVLRLGHTRKRLRRHRQPRQ